MPHHSLTDLERDDGEQNRIVWTYHDNNFAGEFEDL